MIAQVLKNLGSARAMVVHGLEGLDEISLCGPTKVAELRDGAGERIHRRAGAIRLQALSPGRTARRQRRAERADRARRIWTATKGPARDVVLLNSGAALYVSGRAATIQDGIRLAAESIDSAKARQKLEQLVEMTNAA